MENDYERAVAFQHVLSDAMAACNNTPGTLSQDHAFVQQESYGDLRASLRGASDANSVWTRYTCRDCGRSVLVRED